MKKIVSAIINLLLIVTLAACSAPEAIPQVTSTPGIEKSATLPISSDEEDVLYLNLIWHQHQPLYYPDSEGVITRPWVRVHGTKDYYDMAATVAQYPEIHVTFNLTPVLLNQIDAYVNDGAKDKYWVLSEKPSDQLTAVEKEFILTRFFDANTDHIIKVHPGYSALYTKRGGSSDQQIQAALESFSEQDFRDLQIWFNLAWFDPDFLAQEPLLSLVKKDHGFLESDKEVLFSEVRRVMALIIPIHKQMQANGQIEVITSPLAHPILPLLYDTNLALAGHPEVELPKRYQYVQDAIAQLDAGVQLYIDHFGQPPVGLWPSEGAVAPEIVPIVSNAGYQWMASGEQVLANSLGIGAFTRNAEDTVMQADQFYRPYWVETPANGPIPGGRVLMVFRDNLISDKLGFTYSGTPGEEAAADFIRRVESIRSELKAQNAQGPHLVSIILDGENAWENYDQDGKEFLNSLYQKLSESKTIQTVTVPEYLELYPDQQTLPELFRGAWFSPNYDTWIGEPEENAAWNLLRSVRSDLQQVVLEQQKTGVMVPGLEESMQNMYLAEGSDWFWWYGADQDSGNDAYFDEGFRALLANVYTTLGKPVPLAVQVPIIPAQMVEPEREVYGLMPTEGEATEEDWQKAAAYEFTKDSDEQRPLVSTFLGLDKQNLRILFRFDPKMEIEGQTAQLYIQNPHEKIGLGFSKVADGKVPDLIGFSATHLFELDASSGNVNYYQPMKDQWQLVEEDLSGQSRNSEVELKIPVALLGEVEAGDEIKFRILTNLGELQNQISPQNGPGRIILPDFSDLNSLMDISDPQGDDHGPGAYRTPTDPVFTSGVFDVTRFQVRYDDEIVAFDFSIVGELTNPWNGPAGYSLQTLDVYVDTDPGTKNGSRLLLPGRNLSLQEGKGWDVALWAESWTPQVFTADADGSPKPATSAEFKVILDPANSTISLRVNRSIFGDSDPTTWGIAAMVLSQEGYPADGVWRVRDVSQQESQWRFGGAPADNNHTRVIDLVWPDSDSLSQEEILSNYESKMEGIDYLSFEDFAQIPMLLALR